MNRIPKQQLQINFHNSPRRAGTSAAVARPPGVARGTAGTGLAAAAVAVSETWRLKDEVTMKCSKSIFRWLRRMWRMR